MFPHYPVKGLVGFQMPHDIQQIKFMNDFLRTQPKLKELPEFVEAKLIIFVLETFIVLFRLSRIRFQHQVFLDKGLDISLRSYSTDSLSNINQRPVELDFVIEKFIENVLNLRVKLMDMQSLSVLFLELPDHISVVGDHCLQEAI